MIPSPRHQSRPLSGINPPVTDATLPLATRIWLAFVCFFRVLFDRNFAGAVFETRRALEAGAVPPALGPRREEEAVTAPEPEAPPEPAAPAPERPSPDAALQLLALLQREGRLVDFLQQDIAGFSDTDVGAAARVVHEGCRKVLASHAEIAPILGHDEGASVTLEDGFDAAAVKLTGNVQGRPPYRGVVRHRGWRAESLKLPEAVPGHDVGVLGPAEVEL